MLRPPYIDDTIKDAAQVNPIDVTGVSEYSSTHTSMTAATTTTVGNDLLLSAIVTGGVAITGFGSGETEVYQDNSGTPAVKFGCSWKAAASVPGTETMSETNDSNVYGDFTFIAVKGIISSGSGSSTPASTNTSTYAGPGYANPDAVTQIANGFSTSTFATMRTEIPAKKTTERGYYRLIALCS